MTTLHHKAASAVIWSMADVFARQGLQVVVTMVLARMLTPEIFGLVAMLAVFTGVAGIFVDGGFSSALIQRQHTTNTDESTVFFFNLGMGLAVALAMCIAAPWIADFFKQPVLQFLSYASAFVLVVGALGSIHSTLLTKHMNFKTIAKVGAVSTVLSGALAIYMAYRGYGVWSLVGQGVMSGLVTVVLLWLWHPWRPALVFSYSSLRSLFRFGGYLTATSLVTVLHTNLYAILIGKFYSTHDVGIYDRAQRAQMMSGGLIMSVISRVAYPLFSSAAEDKGRLTRGFGKAQRLVMYVNIPFMLAIIILADPIIKILFGSQWAACVPVLQILGIVGIMLPMQILNVNILMAQGRSDLMFNIMLLKRTVAIGLTVAASFYGIIAIAWAQVLASMFSLWVNAYYTNEFLNYGALKQLRDLAPYAAAALPAGIGMWALAALAGLPDFLAVVVSAGVGATIYLLASRLLHVDAHTEIIGMLRKNRSSTLPSSES